MRAFFGIRRESERLSDGDIGTLEAQQVTTKDQLIGTWQLVSFKATSGDKTSYPLGEHPGGYSGYTPTRFWLMFVDSTRKAPGCCCDDGC